MKLLFENWRKHLNEEQKTLNEKSALDFITGERINRGEKPEE